MEGTMRRKGTHYSHFDMIGYDVNRRLSVRFQIQGRAELARDLRVYTCIIHYQIIGLEPQHQHQRTSHPIQTPPSSKSCSPTGIIEKSNQ